MKTVIQNKFFTESPLSITFQIDTPQEEDAYPFDLVFTSDREMAKEVTGCSGTLFSDDIERLYTGLEQIAATEISDFEFAPTDPSFLLRLKVLNEEETEILVVIDQGMQENEFSTDTGIAVLMVVNPNVLKNVANDLRNL